ncbi:unnamed protein product [Arctia plantaginis]|uniref:NF-kappa-B essential modulator NEMO CC2-LZ domain-containing protein n=1 Tax=Arctia plantaginis TaxID=874455 RepID=A0A8S1B3A2_ARCPL|nr:unnamed protein product [Arctia plantaginis]
MKYSGTENGDVTVDKEQMEEAMKDLPHEANMAFKAHFKLGQCGPSPTSMMIASTIINDDKSTEELQKRFGEILDENVILKETLKQNNESMKEQFLLIASCQEDMMKTHMLHKEKFDETKQLVEKLRHENKKLKQDITHLSESMLHSHTNSENGEKEPAKSGPSSAVEFVSSPDDDTIHKLTAQLELVEKQRRQVIVENEKLTWQRESLEHIVDAISKERDELKEKLEDAALKDGDRLMEIRDLKDTIQDLEIKIATLSAPNENKAILEDRDLRINQLESKQATLLADLKASQLRIFELESVKIEMTNFKSGESEIVKIYTEQLQDLRNRLKEVSTIVFQPVRISLSAEPESLSGPNSLNSNVKLYDRTLKHLADVLNSVTQGTTDTLTQTLRSVASLHEFRLERSSIEQFKSTLAELKQKMEKQYSTTLNNVGQVRSTLTIFEGIFRDYNELLNKSVAKPKVERPSANVEALTAALVARGQELQSLKAELDKLRDQKENIDLMKAQLDLYKSDFEAERESRQKMASEKENLLTDLRTAKRRNQELNKHLNEVRKMNPNVYQMSASRATAAPSPSPSASSPSTRPARPAPHSPAATGNTKLTCPKCLRFTCEQYKVMEDHLDYCLDN